MKPQDFYQTAEINTWTGEIASEPLRDSIHKPTDTAAVEAAKRTPLGQVYLDWGTWAVVRDVGQEPVAAIDSAGSAPKPLLDHGRVQRSALCLLLSRNWPPRRADHPSEDGFISWITAKMGEKEWADALKSRRVLTQMEIFIGRVEPFGLTPGLVDRRMKEKT